MKRFGTMLVVMGVILAVGGYWLRSPSPTAIRADGPIVCFGDSLTAGTGASPGMDYPAQLSRKIGRVVINAGRPGDTTQSAASRLATTVLAHRPALVILTLGGNDLKNDLDRNGVFQRLEAMVRRIQADGARVVILGIELPIVGRGFGAKYKSVADRTGALLVMNIYEGLLGRPDRMSDPIHPNDQGYGVIAERVAALIRPHL